MTHVPGAFLLLILAAVVIVAGSVIRDTADGFCLQLEPCHTDHTAQEIQS